MDKHTTLQCSAIPLALALHNSPNKAQKIQTKISQPHYTQKLKKIPRDRENLEPYPPTSFQATSDLFIPNQVPPTFGTCPYPTSTTPTALILLFPLSTQC